MNETMKKEQAYRTGLYVVELLRAVLEERVPEKKPEDLSMESIYQMAKRHSVETMVYEGAVQIAGSGDGPVMEKWNKRSRLCGRQGSVQRAEGKKLCKELPAHGIRILPLKGCIMKDLYPKPEYRQMCDIDIFIDKENAGKAREVMEELGYVYVHSSGGVDNYEKKPWVSVELHSFMLPPKYKNSKKYRTIWERAIGKGGVYQMNWDDYYIYMIEHFAKHFYLGGSGIRSVLDIYIFLQQKQGCLHSKYLKDQMCDRKLEQFQKNMEKLAKNWFVDGNYGAMRDAEEVILLSGAYGTQEQYYRNIEEQIAGKYRIRWLVKLIYPVKRIFVDFHTMSDKYPILKKCPFLLPVMWMHRLGKALVANRDRVRRELKIIGKKDR